MPSEGQASLFDVSHVVFGSIAIACAMAIFFSFLSIIDREPLADDETAWQLYRENHPDGFGKNTHVLLRMLLIWLPYAFYPFAFLLFLLYFTSGRDGTFAYAWSCGYPFLASLALIVMHLRRTRDGRSGEDGTLDNAILTRVLGVRQDQLSFHRSRTVIWLGLILATRLYPSISQSFGGGRPLAVRAALPAGADSALRARAGVNQDSLFLIRLSDRFAAFTTSSDWESPVVLVPVGAVPHISNAPAK